MPVRPLAEADIPQVADLYWKVLRERKDPPPPTVRSFIQELYFTNPWMDSSIPSLVYEDKGTIAGFLGVVPRRMDYQGKTVRIAYGGNFVVHPDFRTTLAGLHLLRTYMGGEQDLSQTDSANDTSRALLDRLGFTTILPFSVHWVRPLRPARALTYAITHVVDNAMASVLAFLATPFSSAADQFSAKFSSSPFRQAESRLHSSDLDAATLISCVGEYRKQYALFPEYDAASLNWLFSFMERMKGHGQRLRKVLLRDDKGTIVGWYVYYFTPGGFADVAQIGGSRKQLKDILDHLFWDAWTNDAIAIHGTLDRRLMDIYSEKNCFFTCRGGWTLAHSRKPGFMDLLNSGDAFLSRLDGEWCLAFGG